MKRQKYRNTELSRHQSTAIPGRCSISRCLKKKSRCKSSRQGGYTLYQAQFPRTIAVRRKSDLEVDILCRTGVFQSAPFMFFHFETKCRSRVQLHRTSVSFVS